MGIGQGNGVGPAIWAAISSPLFAIMKEVDSWQWCSVQFLRLAENQLMCVRT